MQSVLSDASVPKPRCSLATSVGRFPLDASCGWRDLAVALAFAQPSRHASINMERDISDRNTVERWLSCF